MRKVAFPSFKISKFSGREFPLFGTSVRQLNISGMGYYSTSVRQSALCLNTPLDTCNGKVLNWMANDENYFEKYLKHQG